MSRLVGALGDTGLLMPVAVALLVFLLVRGQAAAAGCVAAALSLCAAATVGSKLVFRACGPDITRLDVVSPSGHASMSAVLYGILAILVGAGLSPPLRRLGWAAAAFLAVGIGLSRVRTDAHSVAEVVIGWAIGAASLAAFVVLHRRAGRPALSPWPLLVGFAAALLLFGGRHVSPEGWIARAARFANAAFDICG